MAVPFTGCHPLLNANDVAGKFVIVERGDCMFIDKVNDFLTIIVTLQASSLLFRFLVIAYYMKSQC